MKKHPTDTDLDFLSGCTNEELEFLVRLIIDAGGIINHLRGKAEYEENRSEPIKYVDAIIEAIQLYAGNTRMDTIRGYGVSYRTALQDTLGDLGVKYDKCSPLPELEDRLIKRGIPEFLKHIGDEDIRSSLRLLWTENPAGGTKLNGNLGYSNLTKACKDTIKIFFNPVSPCNPFNFLAAPVKRVVIPAVIHISVLRKRKLEQAKARDMYAESLQSQGADLGNPRSEALVTWQTPQLPSNDALYDFFEAGDVARRESAHDLLVVTGASSVAVREAINPDKVYRLVKGGISEVPGSGGNIRGVEWNSGPGKKGMREFAEFKQVGNAAKLASTFFSQGMLIYIAAELNDIKKGIDEIQSELFQSEVSKMKGRIDSAGRTLRYYRRKQDTDSLNNAIQSLGEAIVPLRDAIVRRVGILPSETSLFGPRASKVKKSYEEVMSAIIWLLRGMVALCLLYSVHDPEFGKAEMIRLLDEFREKTKALREWLEKVGRTLAMNDYGEKYYDDVVRMDKTLLYQRRVLSAPNVGISLSGRQLLELQDQSNVSSVECDARRPEMVRM